MKRTPAMERALDQVTLSLFGRVRGGRYCVACGQEAKSDSFRDDLSRDDFHITKLCQKCQDSVYGKD